MQLVDLGWSPFFDSHFEQYRKQGLSAMRIIRENRGKYVAYSEDGEYLCEISGKFRFDTDSKGGFPAVGDWVIVLPYPKEGKAIIEAILPRKSAFIRKVAGRITEQQVVAANIDIVFIVCGLDLNFNLRRIERYLSLSWESGAMPVVLLNKADLYPNAEELKDEVESIALGIDVYTISASHGIGLDNLYNYIKIGTTAAFLGSSGVGKSTIINSLLGYERLKVNNVSREGSRGGHTTTFRELMLLPKGGMVIDTPGMRELQVWGEDEGMKQVFDDIEELAKSCRFRDCSHQSEPGCAVLKAISDDSLDEDRLNSFLKLKREYEYLNDRQTMKANAIEKHRWKKISQYAKDLKKRDKI
ncbi:MAG: ribosome small subunit-dependent GTPase A [Spirochaetota bacterium]|nr:ribosome small subunit-dependent GTPase A [Spirochaetota bacterium]